MSEHAEGRTWSDPRLIVKGRPRWGIMGVEEGVKSTAIPLSPVAGGRDVFAIRVQWDNCRSRHTDSCGSHESVRGMCLIDLH